MDKIDIDTIVREVVAKLTKLQESETVEEATSQNQTKLTIPLEMSARHVHLSNKDIQALFGAPLTPVRELSQPGQYLCKERVRLIGPKGVMDNVAVLGPARSDSQVEISLTDARMLGIRTPIRQSGDTMGTPGIVLAAPTGIVALEQGVIVAGRHIHMSEDDAARFQVTDRELVSVLLEGARPVVFRDVLIRVHKDFRLAMHIDADEANGCGCDSGTKARIISASQMETVHDSPYRTH